jgi:hypothetical protein
MDTSKGVRLVNRDGTLALEKFDPNQISIDGVMYGPRNVSGEIPPGFYWVQWEEESAWVPAKFDPEWGWANIGTEILVTNHHPCFIEPIFPPVGPSKWTSS